MKISPAEKLILIALLVIVVHLLLFRFRQSNDAPYWITVSNYFLTGSNFSQVCRHCVINPGIPALAALGKMVGLSYTMSYFLINTLSFLISGLLLNKLTRWLTGSKTVAAVTSVLFYIDFVVQYHVFSVMPDSVTWMVMLAMLIYAANLFKNQKLSLKTSVYWGILSGVAILTKTNLIFFFPLYPLAAILKRRPAAFRLILTAIIAAILISLSYYTWAYFVFHRLPWDSLLVEDRNMARPLFAHIQSFISSYLYLLPFIILGARKTVFSISKIYLLAMATLTVIPILIWPFIVPRFTFTTFWFFLPLAASGILRLGRSKAWLVGLILAGLYILNTNRIAMALGEETHVQYLQNLVNVRI